LNLVFIGQSFASFLPENNLQVLQSKKFSDSDLVKKFKPFNEAVLEAYKEDITSEGGTLSIDFDFNSATVNAFASRSGDNLELWKIRFLGGMLRHKFMNEFVYLGVLCHELGHHLGGTPRKGEGSWVSVEGQADYFASNQCLKKIINTKNVLSFEGMQIPKFVSEKCLDRFTDINELAACKKTAFISMEIGKFLFKINRGRRGNRSPKPVITKRAKNVVSTTNLKHPKPQCRLDTFFEGSLCFESFQGQKNCPDSKDWYQGARPLCWFKPQL
jgi:hypothetical protein